MLPEAQRTAAPLGPPPAATMSVPGTTRCRRCGAEVEPAPPGLADLVGPLADQLEATVLRIIEHAMEMPDERPATMMALHEPVDVNVEGRGSGRAIGLALNPEGRIFPVVEWHDGTGWEVLDHHLYRLRQVVRW